MYCAICRPTLYMPARLGMYPGVITQVLRILLSTNQPLGLCCRRCTHTTYIACSWPKRPEVHSIHMYMYKKEPRGPGGERANALEIHTTGQGRFKALRGQYCTTLVHKHSSVHHLPVRSTPGQGQGLRKIGSNGFGATALR
jgi:hypothetical protein